MKNKLLFIVMFVLFASFVYACPPGEVCPDQPQAYTYDQFQNDFANDPLVAAQNHPQEYMKYIKENPQAVAENPQAYENAVRQDVKYINQNRDAFLSYAKTKGVTFTSIDGDFKSFDTGTGRIETKGATGQKPTSFSFDEVRTLDLNGGSNFRVNNDGELIYDLDNRGNVEKVKLRGKLETKINAQESLSDTTIDVIVTDGKISIGEPSRGILNLEITDENTAKLLPACKDYGDKNCGFVEVNVKQDNPIPIWRGVLLKGKATIRNRFHTDLYGGSEYQTEVGTKIGVTEVTSVKYSNVPDVDHCKSIEYSCIQENILYPRLDDLKVTKHNLIVSAKNGIEIKIDSKDGKYKSIVVKPINDFFPRVLVGEIDGVRGYVTKIGSVEFDDGSYTADRLAKLKEHPNYASAREEVRKCPLNKRKLI